MDCQQIMMLNISAQQYSIYKYACVHRACSANASAVIYRGLSSIKSHFASISWIVYLFPFRKKCMQYPLMWLHHIQNYEILRTTARETFTEKQQYIQNTGLFCFCLFFYIFYFGYFLDDDNMSQYKYICCEVKCTYEKGFSHYTITGCTTAG